MWDYVKKPNLRLIGVPERNEENESKLNPGHHPGKFPPPSKTGQHSNAQNTENTTKIIRKKNNPKAHNHQIQQG